MTHGSLQAHTFMEKCNLQKNCTKKCDSSINCHMKISSMHAVIILIFH